MYILEIKTPIWNDKKWNGGYGQRAVGIDSRLLALASDQDNYIGVKILSKGADKKLIHPNVFKILKVQAKKFGSTVKKGIHLYIVPLSAMQEIIEKDLTPAK